MEPLFALAAIEGETVTTMGLFRAPGFVVQTEVSRPGQYTTSSIPLIEPGDVERVLGALELYLEEPRLVEVMDAIADLGAEFAAAIAKLKHQRYGIVQAGGA